MLEYLNIALDIFIILGVLSTGAGCLMWLWHNKIRRGDRLQLHKTLLCKGGRHDYKYIGDAHTEPRTSFAILTGPKVTELHVCKRCNAVKTKERSV